MNKLELQQHVNTVFEQKMAEVCIFSSTKDLTPEMAESFFEGMKEALVATGQAAAKFFIESFDVNQANVEHEGCRMLFKQMSEKEFMTIFGKVTLSRSLYQAARGGICFVPLDEKWGMAGEFAVKEVRDSVLFTSAHLTPVETEAILKSCSLFQPSSTAIKALISEAGEFIEEHRAELHTAVLSEETVNSKVKCIVASMDGVNIRLNEPGCKCGRPQEKPTNTPENIQVSSYRNAMVGAFSFYGIEDDKAIRLNSTYVGHSPEERAVEFKLSFERELIHWESQMAPDLPRVLLADGARGIWSYVDGNSQYDNYLKLLDYYHACEHLASAAEALFGKKSDKGDDWYKKWRSKLKHNPNGVENLIRSIKYYMSSVKGKKRKEDVRVQLTFFQRNKRRMTYSKFLEKNLPIGSGPVEAACKSIVKNRLCRSGMRWSRIGAQSIIDLRSLVKSDRWLAFTSFYMQKKHGSTQSCCELQKVA